MDVVLAMGSFNAMDLNTTMNQVLHNGRHNMPTFTASGSCHYASTIKNLLLTAIAKTPQHC